MTRRPAAERRSDARPASAPVGECDGASSDGAGRSAAIVPAPQAREQRAGPPRSDVSAAVTQTTRSASASAPVNRDERRVADVERRDELRSSSRRARRPRRGSRAPAPAGVPASSSLRPAPAREPTGDEDRLPVSRASRAARARRRPRPPPPAAGRSGEPGSGSARRLDHDRRPAAARDEVSSDGPESGKRSARRQPPRRLRAARRRRRRRAGRPSHRRGCGDEQETRASRPEQRKPDAGGASVSGRRATCIDSTHGPEDDHGRGARPRRRPGARRRALPRRRQQPRLPRVLRAAGGARDERRAARRTRCSASRTCSSSCSPTTGRRASRSPGTRGPSIAPPTPRPSTSSTRQGRKPMPDLLREQFPHFRPIVEAFGYRNLEFEGWEADDVIATLATRADEAGVKTCVVSTDRDAFQLVLRRTSTLMMTPRGVSRRQRLHARARRGSATASGPTRCRTSSGSRATRRDNIPGDPRDRRQDRRAADRAVRLARGGDRARRRALARARRRRSREHADQARASKQLATMRRDLDTRLSTRPRSSRRRPTARS